MGLEPDGATPSRPGAAASKCCHPIALPWMISLLLPCDRCPDVDGARRQRCRGWRQSVSVGVGVLVSLGVGVLVLVAVGGTDVNVGVGV